jgi:hypothetical protein
MLYATSNQQSANSQQPATGNMLMYRKKIKRGCRTVTWKSKCGTKHKSAPENTVE